MHEAQIEVRLQSKKIKYNFQIPPSIPFQTRSAYLWKRKDAEETLADM